MDLASLIDELLYAVRNGQDGDELYDKVVRETVRLQDIEFEYNRNKKDQLFVMHGEEFKGFGSRASAYATYLLWDPNDESTRQLVIDNGIPTDDDELVALSKLLEDHLTYTTIFPEGRDDVANLSELHQSMVDSVVDDINWMELARKWVGIIDWIELELDDN